MICWMRAQYVHFELDNFINMSTNDQIAMLDKIIDSYNLN